MPVMGSLGVSGETLPELPLYEEGTLFIMSYELPLEWANAGTESEKEVRGKGGSWGML